MIKDLQNIILCYLDYTEEYNAVIQELKKTFKLYRILNNTNHIVNITFNHYIYYNNDN